jgi:hypothetical protein
MICLIDTKEWLNSIQLENEPRSMTMNILFLIKVESIVIWAVSCAPVPLGIWMTLRGILAWQRNKVLAKKAVYTSGTVIGTSNYGSVVTVSFQTTPGQFIQFTQHLFLPMRYFPRRNKTGSWAPVSYDPQNPGRARIGPPESIGGSLENGLPVLGGLVVLASGLELLHLMWPMLVGLVR